MPKIHLSHSKPRERRAVAERIRTWSYLLLAAFAAALVSASVGLANSEQAKAVQSVEATSGPAQVDVEVATNRPEAPLFSVFPLRAPDRLVVDIPGSRWARGFTTVLPAASPQVQRVRVGQFSMEPPITRVVFDLAVPAQLVSYESVTSTGDGRLRLRVQEAQPGEGVTRAAGEPIGQAPSTPAPRKAPASAPDSPASTTATPEHAKEAQVASSAPEAAQKASEPVPSPATPTVGRKPDRTAAAVGAPVDEPAGAARGRRHLVGFALAAVVMVLAGLGALLVRRRSGLEKGDIAPSAGEATETISPTAVADRESAEPSDAVPCKVVDGYLLLSPQGGKEALASLGAGGRIEARGEVTVELSIADGAAVTPERPQEDPVAAPAADEGADLVAEAEGLVRELGDDDAVVRKTAARALRDLAARGHGRILLSHLRSPDPRVRSVIAAALGEAKAAAAGPTLAAMAQDTDSSVRAAVMYALGQMGEAAAAYREDVLARVDDSEGTVRARAVEALAAIAPDRGEVAELMVELTGDADPLVREAAAAGAFAFALRDRGEPLIGLLADFSRRAQALEVLQMADEPVLRRLLVAARSADPTTGQAAMDTLSYVMSRRWTAADFRQELASPDPEIRMAGLEGLSIVGGAEAMREVRRLMSSDPSPEVRARAAQMTAAWENWVSEGAGAVAGRDTQEV